MDLEHFLVLSALLFAIGLYLVLAKRNIVGILMGIELLFNAVNLTFAAFARFVDSEVALAGHVFVVFIITVAAAEAAVALALAMVIYRTRSSIAIDEINLLKW
ncbi:MAG TPA: NADH-quinone oxidoreductase subunit NuoK [Dehalococcoidia bacterium]|nr:NADH-quinone oxidoreductase subunit NuoK [Dehalococcoidia bacterium]